MHMLIWRWSGVECWVGHTQCRQYLLMQAEGWRCPAVSAEALGKGAKSQRSNKSMTHTLPHQSPNDGPLSFKSMIQVWCVMLRSLLCIHAYDVPQAPRDSSRRCR